MKSSQHRILLWMLAALVMGATGEMAWRSFEWEDRFGLETGLKINVFLISSYAGQVMVSTGDWESGWISGSAERFVPDLGELFFVGVEYATSSMPFMINIGYGWILVLEALVFGALLWKYRRRRERGEREANEANEESGGGQTAKGT
jgi:hypothetical protein